MPEILPAMATFFSSSAGTAIASTAAATAIGYGVSALTRPNTSVAIPPPPGAALVDPTGQQAAASARARAAAAGGLASTITSAGAVSPTGGGKALLGQ